MAATSVGVGLTNTQLAAARAADGELLPPGFEFETNGIGGRALFVWVIATTAIAKGQGAITTTPITGVEAHEVSAAGAGATYALSDRCGVAVADLGAGDAGWMQVTGLGVAKFEADITTALVGDPQLTGATGFAVAGTYPTDFIVVPTEEVVVTTLDLGPAQIYGQ